MFVWLYCRGRINVNKGICKIQFSAQNNFMMECNIFNILGRKPNQPRHSPQHLEAQGGGHSQDNNIETYEPFKLKPWLSWCNSLMPALPWPLSGGSGAPWALLCAAQAGEPHYPLLWWWQQPRAEDLPPDDRQVLRLQIEGGFRFSFLNIKTLVEFLGNEFSCNISLLILNYLCISNIALSRSQSANWEWDLDWVP